MGATNRRSGVAGVDRGTVYCVPHGSRHVVQKPAYEGTPFVVLRANNVCTVHVRQAVKDVLFRHRLNVELRKGLSIAGEVVRVCKIVD